MVGVDILGMRELVLDIETKKEFAEVGMSRGNRGNGRDNFAALGVSLVGVYDYAQDAFLHFREEDLAALARLLKAADRVIGFNILGFDWPVLSPHINIDLGSVPTLDLMAEVANHLGFRVGLSSLAEANLSERKSGDGLEAIRWYRAGEWEKLITYCLHDVRLTRDLYEYGKAHGALAVPTREGTRTVPASWFIPGTQTIRQILGEAHAQGRHVEIVSPSESQEPFVIELRCVGSVDIEAYRHGSTIATRIPIAKIHKARSLEKFQAVQSLF